MSRNLLLVSLLFSSLFLKFCDRQPEYEILVNNLVAYLDDRNNEEIKKLFSKTAIDNTIEIDNQITRFVDFYEGKFSKTHETSYAESGSYDYGKTKIDFSILHYFYTDTCRYFFSIEWIQKDDSNKNNIGISYIYVQKVDDFNFTPDYSIITSDYGIFIKDDKKN